MSEEEEARRDGASLQRNSGRGKWAKGDAVWKGCLVDYKEAKKSFTLNRKVWSKICTDALKVSIDYSPVLKVIIGEPGELKVRLAVVEWSYLESLHEEVADMRKKLKELEQ